MAYVGASSEEQAAPTLPWTLFLLLVTVFLAHLQVAFEFGRPGDFGVDLTVVLIATMGMLYGSDFGFWIGCAGGLFHDLAIGPAPIGLYTMGGMLVGHLSGALWAWTVRSRWGVAGVAIAFLGLAHAFLVQIFLWIGGYSLFWPTLDHVGKALAAFWLAGALCYGVISKVADQRWVF